MKLFTTKSVNIISFVITIIIFLILNYNCNFIEDEITQEQEEIVEENIINNEIETTEAEEENYSWYIEIKSINLKAPIEETTDVDVLSHAVGHFEETDLQNGTVGLAAHNRGYEVNYFENLKSVNIGDEIIYCYNDFSMTYIIDTIEIIENTDWSYLEKVNGENKITLITCVENEPDYRRCVQASEKE